MKARAWAPSRRRSAGPLADVGEPAAQALGPAAPPAPRARAARRRRATTSSAGDRQERDRVGEQRRLDPGAGDDEAGDRRAAGGADREGDVEQRVALAQLPGGREHRGRRGAGQRPGGRGERAVDDREGEHRDERERVDGQREQGEDRGLGGVEAGQHDPDRQRLDPRDERRGEQRRGEVHAAEQGRGRHRAAGLVVDQDRERDLAEPVAELVDEVGEAEVRESREPQRAERGSPSLTRSYSLAAHLRTHAANLQVPPRTCNFLQVL